MPRTDTSLWFAKMVVCLFWAITIPTGCSHQRELESSVHADLEELYLSPDFQPSQNAKMIICEFKAPDYAKGVGEKSALLLYSQIKKYRPEADIAVVADIETIEPDQLYIYAKKNGYDLIVTGNVLFYLDGVITTASRVEEEMHIFAAWGGRLQPVGHAKAVETAPAKPAVDYWLFQQSAKPASSAESLQKVNSVKFARVLIDLLDVD